jgi:tripartite-type tricarboxylate transporter receptor subunit TctC
MSSIRKTFAVTAILALAAAASHAQGYPTKPIRVLNGFAAGLENTATWVGLLGPANLPADIVKKLNDEINKSLAKPEVQARPRGLGAIVFSGTPAMFADYLRKDVDQGKKVIEETDMKNKLKGS